VDWQIAERICIILVANLIFYSKSLCYKYTSDDLAVYKRGYDKNLPKYKKLFRNLIGSIRIFPQLDHFVTIWIHALVCVFIYLAFGATDISFLAALLFAFNPATNQGSVWIAGRGYVYPTLFALMSLTIPILSPLFLFAGGYWHLGYIIPLVFLFSNIKWVLLFMPFIWYFWYKKMRKSVTEKMNRDMFGEDKKIKPQKLILFTKTFGFYFMLCLIPFKNTFYHSFLQSAAGNEIMKRRAYAFDRFFFMGVAVISFVLLNYIYNPDRQFAFCLMWYTVGILPFCNMFRMSQEIAERYMYLPCAGLMMALAIVLHSYPVLVGAFIAMYATKMWFYMDAYTDDYYLIENACLNSPDSWFAWHIRAMKRWDSQSFREAIILWVMAKNISPKEFKILFNIATALRVMRNEKEANEYLCEAEKNIPEGQEQQVGELIRGFRQGKSTILL